MTDTSVTALAAIKAAYPQQYYGTYDKTATTVSKLTSAIDVWSAEDANGTQIDILGLAAASDMIPLTSGQFSLAKNASNIWVLSGSLAWPSRYYASYDTTATQPTAVTGWFDAWSIGGDGAASPPAVLPSAADLVAVTSAQWEDSSFHVSVGKGVQSGAIVDYTAPVVIPLKDQAATALASARTYVNNNYTMLNEATPDAWVTYLKALMAIAIGADTTSTALPTAPAS